MQGWFAHNHEPILMRQFNLSKQFTGKPDTKNWFKNLTPEQQQEVLDKTKKIIQDKLWQHLKNLQRLASTQSEIEMLSEELLEELVRQLKSDVSEKNLPLLQDLENQARWCLDK